MKLTRRSRVVTALIALMSLLFLQLAITTYACPIWQSTHENATAPMTMDATMPGCHGMDQAQPHLCQVHADAGNQSLDKPEIPQAQPFIAISLALILHPVDVTSNQLAFIPVATETTRATAPPLSIRHCCFRF